MFVCLLSFLPYENEILRVVKREHLQVLLSRTHVNFPYFWTLTLGTSQEGTYSIVVYLLTKTSGCLVSSVFKWGKWGKDSFWFIFSFFGGDGEWGMCGSTHVVIMIKNGKARITILCGNFWLRLPPYLMWCWNISHLHLLRRRVELGFKWRISSISIIFSHLTLTDNSSANICSVSNSINKEATALSTYCSFILMCHLHFKVT